MATTDTPTFVPEDTEAWRQVDGQWIPDYESTMIDFDEGEVVTGTVVRIDNDEVMVDIGYKSEGIIPNNELSIRRSVNPHDEVEIGEEVDALVMIKEDPDGRLVLSKKRARFEKAWRKIELAAEAGEQVTGRVIEVVKGGLILDLGVRGFLPASLVDIRRVQDLQEFMGTEINAKVIELNRSRNNVVLSRRAVLEDERREVRKRILDYLNPGDVIEGTISNIVDFGAFVDLDGIDGLIHISELSWSHVNHPSEVIEIGQTVQVKVLDIDRDRQRISLGLKQTREDPWQKVLNEYKLGDELEGKVTKIVTFGAFVELMPGIEGLVHISELSHEHVENPREVVKPGDQVKIQIIEVDAERRRLSLSIKRTQEPPAHVEGEVTDFVPIDASGEGLDLDDQTAVGAALAEAAARARAAAEPGDEEAEGSAEAVAEEASATETTDETPVGEATVAEPVEEAPAKKAPAKKAAAKKAKEAPAEEAPAADAATEEAPAAEAPAEEAVAEVLPEDEKAASTDAAVEVAEEAAATQEPPAAEAATEDAADESADEAQPAEGEDSASK